MIPPLPNGIPNAEPSLPLHRSKARRSRAGLQLVEKVRSDFFGKLPAKSQNKKLHFILRFWSLVFVYFGGGDDPAKNAIAYGRAWAAIGSITPLLDQLFVIQKRRIEPRFAPQEDKLRVEGRIVLTITIGRALALGIRAGLGFLRIVSNKKKGDAEHEPPSV